MDTILPTFVNAFIFIRARLGLLPPMICFICSSYSPLVLSEICFFSISLELYLFSTAGTINPNIVNQSIYNRKTIIDMKIQKSVTINGCSIYLSNKNPCLIASCDVLFRPEVHCR